MLVGGFLVEAEIPDRVDCRKETQHAGLRQPIAESADRFGFLKQPAAFPAVEAGMRYKPPDGYSAFMAFAFFMAAIIRSLFLEISPMW